MAVQKQEDLSSSGAPTAAGPASSSGTSEVGRHLVAVLAADAVEYSRRIDLNQDTAYQDLIECRRIMVEHVRQHGGGTVATPGDFLLATFDSGVNALRAALSMQVSIAQRNAEAPSDRRFDFRIGIGLGDIIRADGDIHGTAVNVAARLQQLAAPGAVLVAGSVFDAVSQKSDVGFRYLGTKQLRNIAQPVRAYAAFWAKDAPLAATVLEREAPQQGWRSFELDESGLRRPSIEVVRFEPLSQNDDTRLVASGIVEELVTVLSRLQGSLIVRHAAPPGDRNQDSGRNHYLLSGSVRLLQSQLVVTARLTDASAETRWAERYVHDVGDDLDVPQLIAREVVAALQIALTEGQQAELWHARTTNFRAWENFLRGHDQEGRYRRESHISARRFYEHALGHDPDYIAALVALAFCHLDEIRLGWSRNDEVSFAEVERLSARAAAIDPAYAELHALLAYMHLYRGDHDAALAAMRHAQELEPRSPELTGYLGALLDSIGRQEEAVETYAAAMRLSAHCPAWIASNLALTCCAIGRLDEAERTYRALLKEHPDYVRALIGLSALYVRQARLQEAQATARRVLLLDPNFTTEDWRRRQPFADPATLDAFVADLTAAGLP